MNNFILSIDGFRKPEVYYTDTGSIYISNKNWYILKNNNYVGNDLCKCKNDYGYGGIVFGLFLVPKIKYCLVLNEQGMLEEKITFKGYNKKNIKVLDFVSMLNVWTRGGTGARLHWLMCGNQVTHTHARIASHPSGRH